jgi:hypothetical protein
MRSLKRACSTLLIGATLFTALNADAKGPCDGVGALCYLGLGAVVVVGGSYYAMDQLKYAMSPWTSVNVELDDGSVVPGKLSPDARSGRAVKTGDTLRLTCKAANGMCELLVLRRDTRSSPYPRSSALYGQQPSIFISVKEGVPNPTMLTIEGTVPRPPLPDAEASGLITKQ